MTRFSASGAERADACPASVALPQHNTASKYSEGGNDGHDVLCSYVTASKACEEYEPPPKWQGVCDAVAEIAHLLEPEMAMAVNVATGAGRILGHNLGRNYPALDDFEIPGTADLVGVTATHVIIIDLKTGWQPVTPAARNKQLRTLALMASRIYGRDAAKVGILVCHEDDDDPRWDWAELDVFDLEDTLDMLSVTFKRASLAAAQIAAGKSPNVSEGAHCKYCPAKFTCPAKVGLAIQVAEGKHFDGVMPLTPERAGIAWSRLQAFKQAVTQPLEAAVRAFLEEHGEIPLPNGSVLRRVVVNGNESLDGDTVWQVLTEIHGREVADQAVERKATKKRLGEVLREVVGKGSGKAVDAVIEAVRDRGGSKRGSRVDLVEINEGSK